MAIVQIHQRFLLRLTGTMTTVREVRAFLGLAGYYRCFVPNFAKIAHPINALLSGISNSKRCSGRKVDWTDECQSSFHHLKTTNPASSIGICRFHFAIHCLYWCQQLWAGGCVGSKAGWMWTCYRRMMLNIAPLSWNFWDWSGQSEKFKDYLTGAKFVVCADNNPVAHLQSAKLGATEQK